MAAIAIRWWDVKDEWSAAELGAYVEWAKAELGHVPPGTLMVQGTQVSFKRAPHREVATVETSPPPIPTWWLARLDRAPA